MSLRFRRSYFLCLATLALAFPSCTGVPMPDYRPEDPVVTPMRPDMMEELDGVSDVKPAPPGEGLSVVASIVAAPETRSQLSDPGGDSVQVLWKAGDTFTAHFYKDGEEYIADFTTDDGGNTTAVFSTSQDTEGSDFVCIYPGYGRTALTADGYLIFDVDLPVEQRAVPNGIENGLNRALAASERLDGQTHLHFYNIPSLIRFRLGGPLAESIREVRFTATRQITGGQPVYNDNGMPGYLLNRFKGSIISPHVLLTGVFEAGPYYYIAVWPGETNGFEMRFSDGDGHFTTLRSSRHLSLDRSVITDLGTINLGEKFNQGGIISLDPVLYMEHTKGSKPVSIAVVPDGFTEQELPEFERLAKDGLDFIFDTEPFRSYREYFNAWILKVPSAESGAGITDGNGHVVTPVNNYFGTKWGESSYDDMRAVDDRVFNFVTANCPDIIDRVHTINEVPVLIIVNDPRHAGRTWFWDTGKAYCMVPFMNGRSVRWRYPKAVPNSESDPSAGSHETTDEEFAEVGGYSYGDWRNVFLHEFGHAFGRLLDEYWSVDSGTADVSTIRYYQTSWAVHAGENISISYSSPPWQELLDRRDELVARDWRYGRIGVFQGGATALFGAWRSERISCMIDDRQYFSAWQRYLLVKRILTLAGEGGSFSFDRWLASDVTCDPIRDIQTRGGSWPGFDISGVPLMPPGAPPGLMEENIDQ